MGNGQTAILEGFSKPGDSVLLRAERDVIAVASNCARIFNPCNGFSTKPVHFTVYAAEG